MQFISVDVKLPEPGSEVEVLRDHGYTIVNPNHPSYGCRFSVQRTVAYAPGVMPAVFACDLMDGSRTTHWRLAEPQPTLSANNGIPDFLKIK